MAAIVLLSFIAVILGFWAILEIRKLRKALRNKEKKDQDRKPNASKKS